MSDRDDIRPGDWVRFYRNGVMVIGEVRYVTTRQSWEESNTLSTDAGQTTAGRVYALIEERDAEVERLRVWHQEVQRHLSYLPGHSGCRRIHTLALGERDCVLDALDRLAAELADAQARVVELEGYVGTQDRECEEEKK